MKRTMLTATTIACLTLTATAQERAHGAGPPPSKFGLIDMAHVFKNYKKFEVLRDDLKKRVEKSSGQANLMAGHIRGLKSALDELDKGTPEFAAAEKQIVDATRKLEDFQKEMKRELLKEESQIYRTIYLEVSDEVKKYAKAHGYTLVMRFDRTGVEAATDPAEVIKAMNQLIVYYRPQDDITEVILKSINARYQQAAQHGVVSPDAQAVSSKPGVRGPKTSEPPTPKPG